MRTDRAAKLPLAAALLALALGAGCERTPDKLVEEQARTPTNSQKMQAIKLSDWHSITANYPGKVLVADLWASWCASCIERFPAMVELSEKYAGKPVQFISLNLDDPGDEEALAWSNSFLQKMEAKFPHFHLNENIMYSFEQLNLLGIPVVLIFDDSGNEAYRLTGDNPNRQFSEADVEQAILTLLQQMNVATRSNSGGAHPG